MELSHCLFSASSFSLRYIKPLDASHFLSVNSYNHIHRSKASYTRSQDKMPITIKPADHPARKWLGAETTHFYSTKRFLEIACPTEYNKYNTFIQSSFPDVSTESHLQPSQNGFVRAAIDAYCYHNHLTLRPEDIWFAILTQLSLHINAHAEELRSFFVAHEGQKELEIIGEGTINFADFGAMARRMSKLLATKVVDPELQPWIMPDFSTTTETDLVIASVIMMGALQKYFGYKFSLLCGIPSVTLLGIREDWEIMLRRLEKLPSLGREPTQFYTLLKPVLTRFVNSFDSPDSPETKDFWQKIVHRYGGGSGPTYLSGWITAFCFWDEDGKSLYAPKGEPPSESDITHVLSTRYRNPGTLLYDTLYHRVDLNDIPPGHSSVPVKVDDNGTLYETIMVAGSMGIRVRSTGEVLEDNYSYANRRTAIMRADGKWVPVEHGPLMPGPDSLQPESGWIMFETIKEPKVSKEAEGAEVDSLDYKTLGDLQNAGLESGQRAKELEIEAIVL